MYNELEQENFAYGIMEEKHLSGTIYGYIVLQVLSFVAENERTTSASGRRRGSPLPRRGVFGSAGRERKSLLILGRLLPRGSKSSFRFLRR